jgi:PAS domain S-box-containing protein
VLDTGEAEHFELVSPLIGRWFEVDISPSAAGLSVAFRDIHRRKRAETALRESEARLQGAVDLVGLAMYSWDPQTKALEWDARVKAMWSLPPEAPVDYDAAVAAVHPEDRARVEAAIAGCADPKGDGVYDIDYRVIGIGDGVERWIATHGQTSFNNGKPIAFLGVALDIIERKHTEQALRDSESRLAAILEQLPVGVGLFDCEGRIQQSNKVLRRFIPGDLIASRDPEAVTSWRAFQADGSLLPTSEYPGARGAQGETIVPGVDFLHTSEAGQETWVRVSATPVRAGNGRIAGAVTVMQDIDQQKRADELNLLLIAELRHRTRNLLAVVSAISDETLAASRSLEDFGTAFNRRLATLARVQDLLVRGEADAVTIGELVRLELRALGAEPDGRRISVADPEVALPDKAVQILALALHELATNARKHGALGAPEGRLAVSWQVIALDGDRRLALEWHESGAAARSEKAGPIRKGFGRTLVEESLPYQLDAETRLEFEPNEVRCSVTMTLATRGAEAANGGS